MPHLDSLPVELWLDIALYLEPRDVLALSHSRSELYKSISRKEIWATILELNCRRFLIFSPSYPINRMTLPQIQLAALGPNRWSATLQRHQVLYGGRSEYPLLRPRTKASVTIDPTHKMRFLIPGGRFLVTASKFSIALWDISMLGAAVTAPPPVARTEMSKRDSPDFKIHDLIVQQSGGDLLRVAVSSMEGDLIMRIFGIRPASPLAQFTELALLHIQTQFDRVCDLTLQEDLLLMRLVRPTSQNTMIWDFVSGKYAIWDIGRLAPKVEATLIHNDIVHFVPEEVLSWKVPSLDNIPNCPASFSAFLVQPIPSSHGWSPFDFTAPFDFKLTFIRPSSWFHHPLIPYVFDALLIPPYHLKQPTMSHRYRLDIDPETQDVKAVLLASYAFPDTHVHTCIPNKTCNGRHLGVTSGAMISRLGLDPHTGELTGREQTCVFSISHDRQTGLKHNIPRAGFMCPMYPSATVQLTPIHNRPSSSQYLCTGSGRLVYTAVGNDESKLWVADYISSPSLTHSV